MNFSWNTLPADLAFPLLKGSVGTLHLGSVAEIALRHTQDAPAEKAQQMLHLGSHLLLAAWEADMLDPVLAARVTALHRVCPCMEKPALSLATILSLRTAPHNERHDEPQQEDSEEMLRHCESMRRNEPENLFWVRLGMQTALAAGQLEWAEQWIHTAQALPDPLRHGLLADVAFLQGEYGTARGRYLVAMRGLPSLIWRERLGETFLRDGLHEEALAQWAVVLARRPSHTNLLLRSDDLKRGRCGDAPLPQGQGLVLLYTWNKAHSLDQTLASLAASSLGTARIVVLDNGCTDTTPQILAAWADRLGPTFASVSLPCNVGAPAGRNWLLSLEETRRCDWLAFVDDDVILPPDWLHQFGGAMREYPDRPVYGCRVVHHDAPLNLQSVDLHLDEGGPVGNIPNGDGSNEPGHIRRFSVSLLHHQVLDFGDFSYMRPCVSVTGCCHILRRTALDEVGLFDLRFSPSQYDDLEHDLRYVLKRQWPVYQGHLRVQHIQQSGRGAVRTEAQAMSVWANMFKLQMLYSPQEYEGIREAEYAMLLADMRERMEQ